MNMDTNAAHIHQAGIGENGDVVIGLEENMDNEGLWQTPENTALDADTQTRLLSGGHYVNMHSDAFPEGEIRGQVLTPDHVMFPLMLSGDNEVPPVETLASGQGALTLQTVTGSLRGAFATSDIDSNAAHIHQAPAGENGDVVLGLDATDAGYQVPAETMLDDELIGIMLDEGHYVNVHSDAFPDGELRDQIAQ